jgi:transposase-like protein
MEQEKSRTEVVEEYLKGGVSLRKVSRRYGLKSSTLHRWVKEYEQRGGLVGVVTDRPEAMQEIPKDVKRLQRELYEARLHVKLMETMIDVAEKELGVPIRKKSGAR